MSMPVVIYAARATIAVTLVMSAIWKLRNALKFRAVFALSIPPPLRSLEVPAVRVLPWMEIAIAGALLAPFSWLSQRASLGALALIGIFTFFLARIPNMRLGCGCWGSPTHDIDRKFYLCRNLAMIIVAGLGSIPVAIPPSNELIFAIAIGLLFAMMLLELPQIISMALSTRTERVVATSDEVKS
jgi:hypothetical protein